MVCLGHTSIKTTQIYAGVVEKKLSEDMQLLKERLDYKSKKTNKFSGSYGDL